MVKAYRGILGKQKHTNRLADNDSLLKSGVLKGAWEATFINAGEKV